jgi:hypothetical protein
VNSRSADLLAQITTDVTEDFDYNFDNGGYYRYWFDQLAAGVLVQEVFYGHEPMEFFGNNKRDYRRAVTELYEEMYAGYGY